MEQNANVQLLYEAGLLEPGMLTTDDVELINRFSLDEVRTMIQFARRAYPEGAQLTKTTDLRSGLVRLCLPL